MDAWCIITVCGVSAFTVDSQAILKRGSGFLRNCLRGGRVPMHATWLAQKEVFIFILKHKGFSC